MEPFLSGPECEDDVANSGPAGVQEDGDEDVLCCERGSGPFQIKDAIHPID